jgi:hypothetical protein
MPISHSDRISGTLYVIANSADRARSRIGEYLHDEANSFGVYDTQKDADTSLHNRYGSYDPNSDRVYAVSLDIRVADRDDEK